MGRANSIPQVQIELMKQGRPEIAKSTISGYLKVARERLTAEDDKLRAARREIVLRALLSDAAAISKALKDDKIKPRWSDRLRCLELVADLVGDVPPVVAGPELPGEDEDELSEKSADELDQLIVELLGRSKDAPEELVASSSTEAEK